MTGIDGMITVARQVPKLALLCLLLGCGCAALPDLELERFLQRRAACDHARGEFPDPPDTQRMREVELQVATYCTGTDAQLARLKHRYRFDAVVSKRLAAFEPRIEKSAP